VLGVERDASAADIKKTYFAVSISLSMHSPSLTRKQLARKYHPDTNTDKSAQDKFLEIQEAYDVRPLSVSDLLY
jgi:molecular chaperone DnaJ